MMNFSRRKIALVVVGSIALTLVIIWLASSLRNARDQLFDGDPHAFRAHWHMDRVLDYDFQHFDDAAALFRGSDYVVAARHVNTRSEEFVIGNLDRRNIPQQTREYLVHSFEILTVYRENNPNFEVITGDIVDVVDVHGHGLMPSADVLMFMLYFIHEPGNHATTMLFLTNPNQALYNYNNLTSVFPENSLTMTREVLE